MPAIKPQDVRNVVFLGHGGAGKTTLAEAMLLNAKVTTRLGCVNDGSSKLDYTDIEKERQHSVDPSLCFVESNGKTINVIDTPGYPDFIGGALSAMTGADAAVIVISAINGIETNTRRMYKEAKAAGLPISFVITKIHGDNVDLHGLMDTVHETFGSECHDMNLPANGGKEVIDCWLNKTGDCDWGSVEEAHQELVESVIEADEDMMTAYLEGEEICEEALSSAFGKAMAAGTIVPVFFTSAHDDVGINQFTSALAKYYPKPGRVPGAPVTGEPAGEGEAIEVAADETKPFIGQAFKITSDPFVGKISWIRILQGTLKGSTNYHLDDEKKTAKIGHLFKVQGGETIEAPQAVAGDIVALAKVDTLSSGVILHEDAAPMYRAMPKCPTPMYSLAVTPQKRGDEGKISEALHRFTDEDPTFKSRLDTQTHETVIDGIGDLHLRVMLAKMSKRYKVDVDTKQPKIAYRETISSKSAAQYRHKKQTGGSGQFGEVHLRVEPRERGAGFEFVSELFGESIPRQYLPAIEKGVRGVLEHGAVAGYPMQDILVAVTDGKHHPVDSKEVAFKAAGKHAFIAACQQAKPVLLEPVVTLEVTIPMDYMGDITSDLAGRRGRILGQDMLPGQLCSIQATAPLAEVMQYNSVLRSITAGTGSYAMEFSHYDPVPAMVQKQIIAEAATAKDED
ncbi:MAG: elongation factor G [Phycisphaerales bacterium]|jgi:elongation factor G|nr:elongation factor G [Phycisphaerales bacterium]MBT7171542.1 elongation factor G [Phycisphaerales bacterium]